MKKALIMLLLLVAVVGSFGMTQAAPPDGGVCSGNVDIECTYDDDDDPETASLACLVWVDLTAETGDGTAFICGEAPAAP